GDLVVAERDEDVVGAVREVDLERGRGRLDIVRGQRLILRRQWRRRDALRTGEAITPDGREERGRIDPGVALQRLHPLSAKREVRGGRQWDQCRRLLRQRAEQR